VPTYAITVLCAGSSMPTSLYTEYAQAYHLPPFATTALFAVYVAAIVPTMVLGGGLSDVWGRRSVVAAGLALSAIGSVVLATAVAPAQLFLGRVLQGTSLGLSTGSLTAALADRLPGRRAAVLASVGISMGSAAGPLLSGLVAAITDRPLVYPFLVHLALLVPAAALVHTLPGRSGGQRWRPRRPSIPAPVRPVFALACAVMLLAWALLGFFLALTSAVVHELDPAGGTFVAGGVVTLMLIGATCAQSVSGRLTVARAFLFGPAAMAGGTVLLTVSVLGRYLPGVVVAAAIVGVGHGMSSSAVLARVTAAAPVQRRGEVLTTIYLVGYLALAVPVLGVGALAGRIGLVLAVLWFGVPTAIGCLAVLPVAARRRAVPSRPAAGPALPPRAPARTGPRPRGGRAEPLTSDVSATGADPDC
jgi:hypothetical protein